MSRSEEKQGISREGDNCLKYNCAPQYFAAARQILPWEETDTWHSDRAGNIRLGLMRAEGGGKEEAELRRFNEPIESEDRSLQT
ncbi:unnamed protein product [Toxocara canis]|uniref:Uncharacterized protein n=1 Tax=Toxocara canis TaxID=6265 RepID=A0A183USM5_TOXCA|nr:unnamed protein product [Toxocara canis]